MDPGKHGRGGQAFRRTHPFARWLTVGPVAVMMGLALVAGVAALLVIIFFL